MYKNNLEQFNKIPPGKGVHLPCHLTSPTIYSKHSQTKKSVENKYHYEERYRPLKFQICTEMIGKCTCQMAHNCLKIDNLQKFVLGRIENYMYCKNICVSISMKCLVGGIIYHTMSLHPLSISSIQVLSVLNFLKCTF